MITDFWLVTTLTTFVVFVGIKGILFFVQVIEGSGRPTARHCRLVDEPTWKVLVFVLRNAIDTDIAVKYKFYSKLYD